MNAAQAKKISLYDLLSSLGYNPVQKRKSGNEVWYNSPLRNEKEPSFKIRLDQNVWYDFGEGAGGNVLDFVMKFKGCNFNDALSFLGGTTLKPSVATLIFKDIEKQSALDFFNLEGPLILNVKPLHHYALKKYLRERCISAEIGLKHLKEINYKIEDKIYFALGFENVSGGWEVRNSLFKGCLGKKDISLIETGSNKVSVFEGFFDYLSSLAISGKSDIGTDVLILNSTSMKGRGLEVVKEKGYNQLDAYFDNDSTGEKTLAFFKQELPDVSIVTQNHLYAFYKDFNEFHTKAFRKENKHQ